MYEKHVGSEHIEEVAMDVDIDEEYKRQNDYLEITVEELKRKLTAQASKSAAKNMKAIQENGESV